ncbi:hypothetical protein JCM10212_004847 [Sporobolomyces blumeae]
MADDSDYDSQSDQESVAPSLSSFLLAPRPGPSSASNVSANVSTASATSKGKGKATKSGKQKADDKDVKRRSSKACDNCRKAKSRCARILDPATNEPVGPCQNCLTVGAECTFNGATRKRGPPKGYIEAIESRLHRMEALLGGLLQNDDPRAQALLGELIGDEESRDMLTRDLKAATGPQSKPEKSWKREFALQQEAQALQEKKRQELEAAGGAAHVGSSVPTSLPPPPPHFPSAFSPGFSGTSFSNPATSGETSRWFTDDDLNFGAAGGSFGAARSGGSGIGQSPPGLPGASPSFMSTFSGGAIDFASSGASATAYPSGSSIPIPGSSQPPSDPLLLSTSHLSNRSSRSPTNVPSSELATSPRQRRKLDPASFPPGSTTSTSPLDERKQMAYSFTLPSAAGATGGTGSGRPASGLLPASVRATQAGPGLPPGAIGHTGLSTYTLSTHATDGAGSKGGATGGFGTSPRDRHRSTSTSAGAATGGDEVGAGGDATRYRDGQGGGPSGSLGQSPGAHSILSSSTGGGGGGGTGPGAGSTDSPLDANDAVVVHQGKDGPDSELADVIGQLSLNENEEVRYHGRSSGLYLISQSRRFRDFFWQFPSAGVWPPADGRIQKTEREILQLKEGEDALPDLETQNHLLQAYWTYVHPHFPILYKVSFMRQYRHSLAHPNSSATSASSPSSHAFGQGPVPTVLLLSMFALSARYCDLDSASGQDGKYWNAGQTYLDRARMILNHEYGSSKLVLVQALLLGAYREIGVGAMSSAWMAGGMAIRMAQDLGLFRDVEKWFLPVQRFTHEEKQTRKRIWWGCIIIDRYTSSYIGRPGTIHERDYDTGFCSEDEPDEHEQWRPIRLDGTDWHSPPKNPDSQFPEEIARGLQNYPTTRANTLSCFNAHAALAVIINRIISNIYAIRIRVLGQSSETLLSLLDQSLASWYLALPPHLAYNPASSKVPAPHILALHLQFYSSLILLHRPFIPGQNSAQSPGNFPSHSICTTSANAIANIITAWRKTFTLRQCPPFVTYPLFSAAIICVYNASFDEALARPAKLHLLQLMNALKEMELQWGSAIRAFELLHGLVDLRDAELNAELAGLDAEVEGRGTKRPTMDVDEPTKQVFHEVRPTNFHANRPVVGRSTSTRRKPSRSVSSGGPRTSQSQPPPQGRVPAPPVLSSPSIPQVPFFPASPQDWRAPPTVAPSPASSSSIPPLPPPIPGPMSPASGSTSSGPGMFSHVPPEFASAPGPGPNPSAQTFDILNPALDLSQFRSPPGTSGGVTNFSDLLNSFLSPTEAASLPSMPFAPPPITAPPVQPGTPFDPTSAFFGMPLGAVDEWLNYSFNAFGGQSVGADQGSIPSGGGSMSPEAMPRGAEGVPPSS